MTPEQIIACNAQWCQEGHARAKVYEMRIRDHAAAELLQAPARAVYEGQERPGAGWCARCDDCGKRLHKLAIGAIRCPECDESRAPLVKPVPFMFTDYGQLGPGEHPGYEKPRGEK